MTEQTRFIRVYDGLNSQQQGGWLMREEEIVGLTPEQIRNKFAIPFTPKHITDVVIESGTKLRMREANRLFGFDGGGTQFDLMGQYVGELINP